MSSDAEWKGHRLGAYQIGERYTDVPDEEGRLYAAHHLETGETALVVMPGPDEDWPGATPWSAETTRFIHPKALVIHPRCAEGTQSPTLHELTLGFIRSAGALAGLDVRAETRSPFFPAQPRHPARRQVKRWGRLVGAALALAAGLAFLLWPRDADVPKTEGSTVEAVVFGSERGAAPPALSYAMPDKPFKEQAKPPCIAELEVEIRGGCWNELSRTAPCARGSAEYQGKCYLPVKKADPKPTSVQP